MNLYAAIEDARGNFKLAEDYAKRAIQVEPDFEESYWTLINIYCKNEQFTEAVKVVQSLEQNFGYQFTQANFAEVDIFQEFSQSAEFLNWLQNKQG